ncbi:hypothetical protein NHG32_06440 [Aerococcaceae bacterium NML191219]|nr:hypothetical protein [Aerococcaceae bacterium NML191219]
MIRITFNEVDVYATKRIVLEHFDITLPKPKLIKVSVPGRDGDLDMSEALTGYVNYHNREIKVQLGLTGSEVECEAKKQYLLNLVAGNEIKIRFSHLSGYFEGRCQSMQAVRSHRHYMVELVFDCQPYRLAESETTYTLSLTNTEQSLRCANDTMPVVPTIVTTGITTIKFKSKTYSVQKGTHRLGFIFGKGVNVISASGTGMLTVRFRKGVL